MDKLKTALTSRTVWTIIFMFIINGLAGIADSIPADTMTTINAVLSVIAIYFRIDAKK